MLSNDTPGVLNDNNGIGPKELLPKMTWNQKYIQTWKEYCSPTEPVARILFRT